MEKYFTIRQAAEILNVCKKTIARRIADGSIAANHLGHRTIRISEENLKKYIENHQ